MAAPAAGGWRVGDRALARDKESDLWKPGTVTELRGDTPVVRLDEHHRAFTWRFVERPSSEAISGQGQLAAGTAVRVRDSPGDEWKLGQVTDMRGARPLVRVHGHDRPFLWRAVEPLVGPSDDPRVAPRRPPSAERVNANSPQPPSVGAASKAALIAGHRLSAIAALSQLSDRCLRTVYWQKLLRLALVAEAERSAETAAGGQRALLCRIRLLEQQLAQRSAAEASARAAGHRLLLVRDTEAANSRLLLCVYYQKLLRRALVAESDRAASTVEGGQQRLLARIRELEAGRGQPAPAPAPAPAPVPTMPAAVAAPGMAAADVLAQRVRELEAEKADLAARCAALSQERERPRAQEREEPRSQDSGAYRTQPVASELMQSPGRSAAALPAVGDGGAGDGGLCVKAAAGVCGLKRNVRLAFPARPTMAELLAGVAAHYSGLQQAEQLQHGQQPRPFHPDSLQLYDRVVGRWVDLYSTAQLQPDCQIYCFQPEGVGGEDEAQGYIPAAARTVVCGAPYSAAPSAAEETARSVLAAIRQGSGLPLVSTQDLRVAFLKAGLPWTPEAGAELYSRWAADPQAPVTTDDWMRWCAAHPQALGVLAAHAQSAGRYADEQLRLQLAWQERERVQAQGEALLDARVEVLRRDLAQRRADGPQHPSVLYPRPPV